MTARRSNDYVIELKTDKDLGAEPFARRLLGCWLNDVPAELRPERFDRGEPVRRSFEEEGLERAVRMWVDNRMPLYLRRRTRPKMMVAMNWRPEKGQDPRPFPFGCTVWLHRSAGDHLALLLFSFLIEHFEPAFGSVSSEEDSRAKHWVSFRDRQGQTELYVGLDVGRFVSVTTDYGREVLPGVYWLTYFGPGALSILGARNFERLSAQQVEKLGAGYLVRAYASLSAAGTPAALRDEEALREQLGRRCFFDKSEVDLGGLKFDEASAARGEALDAARK